MTTTKWEVIVGTLEQKVNCTVPTRIISSYVKGKCLQVGDPVVQATQRELSKDRFLNQFCGTSSLVLNISDDAESVVHADDMALITSPF